MLPLHLLGERKVWSKRGNLNNYRGLPPALLNTNTFPSFLKDWGCIFKSQHKLSRRKTLPSRNKVHVLTNMLSPSAPTQSAFGFETLFFPPRDTPGKP